MCSSFSPSGPSRRRLRSCLARIDPPSCRCGSLRDRLSPPADRPADGSAPAWLASALPPADAGHYGIASPPQRTVPPTAPLPPGSHRLSLLPMRVTTGSLLPPADRPADGSAPAWLASALPPAAGHYGIASPHSRRSRRVHVAICPLVKTRGRLRGFCNLSRARCRNDCMVDAQSHGREDVPGQSMTWQLQRN